MSKLPRFSRDACTSYSASQPLITLLINLGLSDLQIIHIKAHYFYLDYQDRGRESYGPYRNSLDRRVSFFYRSRMFIVAKIKSLMLFILYRLF